MCGLKTIRAGKDIGSSKTIDIQTIISEKPSTVDVYRTAKDFTAATPTRTKVATFEARIDEFKYSWRDEKKSVAGQESDTICLMTTCYSEDKDGNGIDFQRADEVIINSVTYRVAGVKKYTGWKREGTLVLIS